EIRAEGMLDEDRAQALEDIGRRQRPGDRLAEGWQHGDRVEDRRDRHDQEHQRPGEALRAHAIPENQAGDDRSDRPGGEEEAGEEGAEREAEAPQVETEEPDREERDRYH